MKSENGVSSFSGSSKIRIAEVCGGFGKSSGSAIWDSSSKEFSLGSIGLSARIWSRIHLASLVERCKNDPPEDTLRSFKVFILRPI
jgi:hypothetical protein